MRTERRWGLRKTVEADVVIDNQPAALLRGRIGNVSVGGLYVSTTPAALMPDSCVELVLMHQAPGGTQVYRLAATVVRRANEGVGLMIYHYDLDAFRALVALLLEHTDPSTGPAAKNQMLEHDVPDCSVNTGDEAVRLDPALAGTAGTAAVAVTRVVPISHNDSPHRGDKKEPS